MHLPHTIIQEKARRVLRRSGPLRIKRWIWNREFLDGRWGFLDSSVDDCVYPFVQRYVRGGSLLDLGCGSGSTANELPREAYCDYLGVDVSDIALAIASKRTRESGRSAQAQFVQGDLVTFTPPRQFDVILFRESIYYVPVGRIGPMLQQYSRHLNEGGVFVAKLYSADGKLKLILDLIERCFRVLERGAAESGAVVLVFRPKADKPLI